MNTEKPPFTLAHLEVLLLAATLLATVIISAFTLHQTTRNFEIERTSGFVARLNSEELVALREKVDRWLDTNETPAKLFDRANGIFSEPITNPEQIKLSKDSALKTISELRTLTNFFQEFGTALRMDSLDEEYGHALIGGLCIRYGIALEPFIHEMRIRRRRPQVYEEVFLLKERMEYLDAKKKPKNKPNYSLQPTIMPVTDAATQPPHQP